jgi:hypothetical protein
MSLQPVYHYFREVSNNSRKKAKIEGKNEQTFGAFTTLDIDNGRKIAFLT